MSDPKSRFRKGPLAYMAENSVAANLLMLVAIVTGLLFMSRVKQEVFPEVDLDIVSVLVPYPGASPGEVERGVILAVEEAIRGVDGIKRIIATAKEGSATVSAELLTGTDPDRTLNDVKAAVDRITSLPNDAERPVVAMGTSRKEVITVIVSGEASPHTLKGIGERIRSDLLENEGITTVDVTGLPAPEISIEVSQVQLRRYGITLQQIADAVRAASVEIPGGGVRTDRGEVLIRTTERRESAEEFANIAILRSADGTDVVTVGDVATIVDGFRETDRAQFFNGKPAVAVGVFRVGSQTPIAIAETVRNYVADNVEELPNSIELTVWGDRSKIYRDRINLLLRNAAVGLILVLLVLGLFLEMRLAFWVTVGIPISFFGAFLFLPAVDVSINMISLFGFLLVLGIVVDDAIVVGEAVFLQRRKGLSPLRAAIAGAREVSTPVMFAVFTTIAAFAPMLFIPGVSGKFFIQIPMVVLPILFVSLIESFFVLPAHLAHSKKVETAPGLLGSIRRVQERFSYGLEEFVEKVYSPFCKLILDYRYVALSASVGLLILTFGFVGSGGLPFTFMPKIEGDLITASVQMPFGTPVAQTEAIVERLSESARETLEEFGEEQNLSRGILANVGTSSGIAMGPRQQQGGTGGHLAAVSVFLVPSAERDFDASSFTESWRARFGEIPGVERLAFKYDIGPGAGAAIGIKLTHTDTATLERSAAQLAHELQAYNGVKEVNDGFEAGKEQLDLKLRPEAKALGVTEASLARQVRSAFFGQEAVRQQRKRDEVRVYVRRPLSERRSEHDIESLLIRTPAGGEIPLRRAASVTRGRSYTTIRREDGRRSITVTADVDPSVTTANKVMQDLTGQVLPRLTADFGGLSWSKAGQQNEQAETMSALLRGMFIAMLFIYALLAVAFRSYIQPVVIMFAIPFGIVGAFAGHLIMGYGLSMISMMGIVALTGVVVNDSLVLIDAVNQFRRQGMGVREAVEAGGMRRFRPILLTSLTTFFGLAPMIFEQSVQARFLIPMAISLGFGVLFVTVIALVIVPAAYVAVADVKVFFFTDDDDSPVEASETESVSPEDFPELTGNPRESTETETQNPDDGAQ